MSRLNQQPAIDRRAAKRRLLKLQREVVRGQQADDERRRLIVELFRDGMSQVELSDLLSKTSRSAGGEDVGIDAVQKICTKLRYVRWEES